MEDQPQTAVKRLLMECSFVSLYLIGQLVFMEGDAIEKFRYGHVHKEIPFRAILIRQRIYRRDPLPFVIEPVSGFRLAVIASLNIFEALFNCFILSCSK